VNRASEDTTATGAVRLLRDGDGDQVVIVGDETFRVKETGVTHEADWAWVYEVHDGLITRILAIEDLSGIEDTIRQVVSGLGRRPGR
jgi:ketosteroid isomerase-like protein